LALWECFLLTPVGLKVTLQFGMRGCTSPIRHACVNATWPGFRRTHAAITDEALELRVAVQVVRKRAGARPHAC
jgi:hypothetical protein